MSFNPTALIIVLVYLALLGLAVWRYGGLREQSVAEYAVASRSFKWYWIIFTVVATWFPGSIYTGWFGWAATGGMIALYGTLYSVAALVLFYILAPRIWIWGKVHDLYNMPDFISLRYGSKNLGLLFAIAGIIIGAPWQVMAFKTFGYLTDSITGGAIPFNVGMFIAVALCISYIIYGGMRSDVVTDFFQGIISTFIILGGIVFVIYKLFGGFGPMLARVAAEAPQLLVVEAGSEAYWASIILTGTIGGYCWLEMFNRIYIAESVREVRAVAGGAPILTAAFFILLLVMGLGGGLLPEVTGNPEAGFFTMFQLAGGPVMLGFAAIVVIAAEMSSLDSQITSGGVVFTQNVVGHFKKAMGQGQRIRITRTAIAIYALLAYWVATMELPMLVTIAIFSYEFLVHLFPGVIIGAFWKRANAASILSGFVAGMVVSTYLMFANGDVVTGSGWTAGIVGLAINLIVFVAVALATPPAAGVDQLFEEVDAYQEGRLPAAAASPAD